MFNNDFLMNKLFFVFFFFFLKKNFGMSYFVFLTPHDPFFSPRTLLGEKTSATMQSKIEMFIWYIIVFPSKYSIPRRLTNYSQGQRRKVLHCSDIRSSAVIQKLKLNENLSSVTYWHTAKNVLSKLQAYLIYIFTNCGLISTNNLTLPHSIFSRFLLTTLADIQSITF